MEENAKSQGFPMVFAGKSLAFVLNSLSRLRGGHAGLGAGGLLCSCGLQVRQLSRQWELRRWRDVLRWMFQVSG